MLHVQDLHAYYGNSHVLQGVCLDVQPGEIVALLGRNGSGRSTTAKAIMGLVQWHGTLQWCGQSLAGLAPHDIAQQGLGYVPESRDVFAQLTVQQNLLLGQKDGRLAKRWSLDDMYQLFPQLRQRQHTRAGVLSGGEQQMLTLCRTLMGNPELILIDEPTEGLAPQLVALVGQFLHTLRQHGVAVLLIEQKLAIALEVSDRVVLMGQGRVVFEGTPESLRARSDVRQEWLQV
ncbi:MULTISPECIES: ABC transporter ATP-binding protein [Giesbergeria]|uniref:ABC transporter ATP-binding protein n=1 Tax=Giesbergeria sinuosa TaxID=80883 RepID=A0ABV9QE68_9BURK